MASNSLGSLTIDLIANTGGFIAPLDAAERATQKALGRMGSEVDAYGNKVDETYKKIGLSTKQLDNSFDRISENMRREIALYKDSSRAAVLKYDLENGSLRALSDSQKQYLAGLTRDLAVLDKTTGGAGGSMRSFRGVMQSAGYQAQDVAVQIQAGTSAFQIFSQQGSQFASAFGPGGAVLGAFIAVAGLVGGVLFKSFMDTQKAVKDLEANLKDLTKEYGALNEAQKSIVNVGTAQVLEDLTKKYDEADTALQKQKKSYDELIKSQTLDLTWKNAGISALVTLGLATDALTSITGALGLGQTRLTESAYGLYSVERDQADARRELTASTVAHLKALRDMQEAQDVTGATKVIRELTDEISLMGLRGKALYEATAALKGYDEANTKAFVAVMLLKDANKDTEDFKKRIKDLDDETIALQLKNAEIHKNVKLMDELATKLADSKNTRPDGTRISTPEDQKAITDAEKRNTVQKEKNDLDAKSVALYDQQDKSAKDRIKSLEREVALFGISSKAQQLEYDIKSGLIKVNGGLESQQAKRMILLTEELALLEKQATLAKAQESVTFAGYDNSKGDLESTRMQYELDTGILKVNKDLTKEYYDQLIAQKKIEEEKAGNKSAVDYLKNQTDEINKARLLTGEEKLRYDLTNGILFTQKGITDEQREQVLVNQRTRDAQIKQLELTKTIKDGIVDALLQGASEGKDIFQNLADTAKGIFQSLVLKPVLDNFTDDLAKQISSVLGSVGTKDSTGKTQGATGVLGSLGPWGLVAAAVVTGVSISNKEQAKTFAKMEAAYRQGTQSMGTILGEANKKSESISQAIENLGDTAYNTLGVNRNMYQALLDIKTGIAGTAAGFARQISIGNVGGSSNAESSSTLNKNTINALGGSGLALTNLQNKVGGNAITEFVAGFTNALAGKIASAIYSSKTKVTDSGIKIIGTSLADILTTGTIEAFTYADIKTTKKFLGLTTSTKVKESLGDLDSIFETQFAGVFKSAGAALEEAGKAFGAAFDPSKLVVDTQKLSLKGLEGDALTKEIENFFSATLDNWAGVLVSGTNVLTEFQQVGEGAFETVIRLASQMNVFNDYAELLNLNFNATGVAAIEASQAVIEAAGGFDKLTQSLSEYYGNFYTEAERADKQMESLAEQFKSLGYDSVPATREEFRALVESIDVTTKSGAELFSSLIGLSGSFAELVKWGDEVTSSTAELLNQFKVFSEYVALLDLNFSITGAAAIEASQAVIKAAGGFDKFKASADSYYGNFYRDSERAEKSLAALTAQFKTLGYDTVPATREEFRSLISGIDLTTQTGAELYASMIGLSGQFASLVEWTDSAEETLTKLIATLKDVAGTAFDALSQSIQAEKSRIQGIVDNASKTKTALTEALGREKDTITTAHNERLQQLQDQAKAEQGLAQQAADAQYELQKSMAKAQQEATRDQIKVLEKSVSGLSKLFDDLNSVIFDMAIVTDDVTRARRRAAEFEIDTAITNARAGRGVPSDGRLNDALAILKNNPTQLYASLEDMAFATAVTQNKLQDLANLTDVQMTTEQQTITLLTQQLSAQELAADSIQKLTVAISADSQAKIDDENARFEKQLETLDAIAEDARKQFDALSGIDTSVISLQEAQDNFAKALLAADFVNAQDSLNALAQLEIQAKNQLNALLGIDATLLSVDDSLRAFSEAVLMAQEKIAESGAAVAQSSILKTYEELLEEQKAMREEQYDINQQTRKNTQETADILRQMQEEAISV